MLIGSGFDVYWFCYQVHGNDPEDPRDRRSGGCFKDVLRGLVPLPDGRWWRQVWYEPDQGAPHWVREGPWVSEKTWA